ncbi:MAG: hypothetical protein ACFCVG_13365 [Kineosporiaceae bacterium]
MALRKVGGALRRNVVVVLVGVLATAGALAAVHAQEGLHLARAGVVLLPPGASTGPNPFWGREYSVIATAGVLASMVNDESGDARPVSSAASLAGQGERDGYAVRLRDRGGQWSNDFDRPVFDVQAVGPTPAAAAAHLDHAVADLEAALASLHDRADVPEQRRMRLELVPERPEVAYAAGRPARALAATALLGAALTVAAVLAAERLRARRSPVPGPAASVASPVPAR